MGEVAVEDVDARLDKAEQIVAQVKRMLAWTVRGAPAGYSFCHEFDNLVLLYDKLYGKHWENT